jgi:beta-phosphoglucomutase-like phosphatase (HAD superfamily)
MMDLIITSDDKRIKNKKPYPDCYLLAAELLNVPSTKCVVVEDSPEGMRSGKSAGCKVVAVPAAWTKNTGRQLAKDFLITTLMDFPFGKLGIPKMRN